MPGRSLNSIITTSPRRAAHARESTRASTDASRAKHAPPLCQRLVDAAHLIALGQVPAALPASDHIYPRPSPRPSPRYDLLLLFLGGGGLRFGLMSSRTAILKHLGQAHS